MTELSDWLKNGETAANNPQHVAEAKRPSRGPGKRAIPVVVMGQPVERPHKYNAQRTEIDGVTFDSKREAQRYQELQMLAAAGEIHDLELQPRYELQPAFKDSQGKRHRAIYYVADFQYVEDATGHLVVEDVKGMQTAVFKLKIKLFLSQYPHVIFRVVK